MRQILVLTLLLTHPLFVFATEPMSDYHFQCGRQSLEKGSNLLIRGGVDPSGLFAISLAGSGTWKLFRGLEFLSQRRPLSDKTNFVSINSSDFRAKLTLNWNEKIGTNIYSSSFVFQNSDLKIEIKNLDCKIAEESL